MNELLPSFQEETDSSEGHSGSDAFSNGYGRDVAKSALGPSGPQFPQVDKLLSLFKDSCKELVDLRRQV